MLKRNLVVPSVFLIIIVVWAFLAPSEATLGKTMRWVYLHVAFTWGGTSLVNVAGLVGLAMIVYPVPRVARWAYSTELAAVVLYATGFLLSLISAWASWGGVLWQEPRVIASILILGAGVAVVFVLKNLTNTRLIGLLALAYSALLSYQLAVTAVVFHPAEPIDASDSEPIKLAFYGMAVLSTALGVSLILMLERLRPEPSG